MFVAFSKSFYFLALLFLIGVTGCVAKEDNSLVDKSFLTDQPCAAPCWYGLEPDKSTKEDVYATLKKLSFVDQSKIQELATSWGGSPAIDISFRCLQTQSWCGTLLIADGKLKEMWFGIDYELTFEKTVQKLGVPDFVVYGSYHPLSIGSEVQLFWMNKQVVVSHIDPKELFGSIRPGNRIPASTMVTGIVYGELEMSSSPTDNCCPRIPWPGFGQ